MFVDRQYITGGIYMGAKGDHIRTVPIIETEDMIDLNFSIAHDRRSIPTYLPYILASKRIA